MIVRKRRQVAFKAPARFSDIMSHILLIDTTYIHITAYYYNTTYILFVACTRITLKIVILALFADSDAPNVYLALYGVYETIGIMYSMRFCSCVKRAKSSIFACTSETLWVLAKVFVFRRNFLYIIRSFPLNFYRKFLPSWGRFCTLLLYWCNCVSGHVRSCFESRNLPRCCLSLSFNLLFFHFVITFAYMLVRFDKINFADILNNKYIFELNGIPWE